MCKQHSCYSSSFIDLFIHQLSRFFGKGILFALFLSFASTYAQPTDFIDTEFVGPFNTAVGLTFDANGRMFVWEKAGKVWIVENGVKASQPLIDISEEVGDWADFGLLGFALDPEFLNNGNIYLLYIVDRHHLLNFGTPSYDSTANDYFKATIGRITRYTANSADNFTTVDYNSRTILMGATVQDGFPNLHTSHGVADLVFGTDGSLMASFGDGASWATVDEGSASETYYLDALADSIITPAHNVGAYRVQLLDSYAGKIIRMNPQTGEGYPSNPFYQVSNPSSIQSRVWALGLRNPCRMNLKPGTGSHNPGDGDPGVFYIGDVSWGSAEEINVCDAPGQNFGWPKHEGMTHEPGYFNPTYAPTSHELAKFDWRLGNARANTATGIVNVSDPSFSGDNFTGNCSIGGVWYEGDDFPAEYKNTYFHADYGGNWIRNFGFDENENPTFVKTFKAGADQIVYLTSHPIDGALYYLGVNIADNYVRKISYAPGNLPPVAIASANPNFGQSPLDVQFQGALSGDPDGDTLTYLWSFGDGNISTEASPLHTYNTTGNAPASYNATLRVTDPSGLFDEKSLLISLNNTPPVISSTSIDSVDLFSHINPTFLNLSAVVTDAEHSNNELTYQWVTALYHNNHNHNEPADNTPITSVTLPPVGCDGVTYWYRITLTVTDPEGLSTSYSKDIYPDCSGLVQTISFDPIPNKLVSDPSFTINPTSSSGLPITTYIASGPATISGNTINLSGQTGVVTVRATQSGNSTYQPAIPIDHQFLVSYTSLQENQTIDFPAISDKIKTHPPFIISATASSGLPVSFEIVSGPATISNDTLSLDGVPGTVIVKASQAGNGTYAPAVDVLRSFEVIDGFPQTISFDPIADKMDTDPPFTIAATASSNLPVSFSIVSGPATISGDTITLSGTIGTVVVEANQAGDSTYAAAAPVQQSFEVKTLLPQTINFPTLSDKFDTDPPFSLSAVASSGLAVSYSIVSGPAILVGDIISLTGGLGTVIVKASQPGDSVYAPAPDVERSFEVLDAPLLPQTISFDAISDKLNTDPSFVISATASSGLPVSLSIVSGPASINLDTITLTGATGTVIVRASQSGDSTYAAAVDVDQSFEVSELLAQTINFAPIADKLDTDLPFDIAATASSGLSVNFSIISGPATISGNTVSLTGATGTVTIRASQAGDSVYLPAPDVEQSFEVKSLIAQTIDFSAIGDKQDTNPPFTIVATASSGLPVSFSIVSGPATVSNDTISLTGATGTVTVKASQAGDSVYLPAPDVEQSFEVISSTPVCTATGSILMERWNNIPGWYVDDIPLDTPADEVSILNEINFQIPPNNGEEYGIRLRGYICPPQTGDYTFWIVSDDRGQLWLSTNDDPENKGLIAEVDGWTGDGEWEKYPEQTSTAITLNAGERYYVEVLMKEGFQGDHMAIGWQLPDGTLERPMPAAPLSPYDPTNVGPLPQTISFDPIPNKINTDPAFDISATATSGLAVSFTVLSGPATLSGNTITLDGNTGTVSIIASQAGDSTYDPAPDVLRTFEVLDANAPGCTASGSILMEKWNNVPGYDISTIPVNTPPDEEIVLINNFEIPVDGGETYGARVRGYICAPQTGTYTFWIASDDGSQLWLSTNDDPTNKSLIAEAPGWTNEYEWDKYASQQSAGIELIAGQRYYVEALFKEGFQGDHMAVGWQTPDGNLERPMQTTYLSPSSGSGPIDQTISFNSISNKINTGGPFTLNATASSGLSVSFSIVSGPATVSGNTVTLTGALGTVTVEANQAGNENFNPAPSVQRSFEVIEEGQGGVCVATGNITMDKWNSLAGWLVEDVPFNTPPDEQQTLTIFEIPADADDQYGARVRGYICPPVTGDYTFWVASDDNGQLWLSTDDQPGNSSMIAEAPGWTNQYEWDKYTEQQSAAISLIAGQRYYIEARFKEGFQGDHLEAGWQLPGGTLERPIPGTYLSPVDGDEQIAQRLNFLDPQEETLTKTYSYVIYPNPFQNSFKIDMSKFEVGEVAVEVRNLLGQIVYAKARVGSNEEIEIGAERPNGIYIIRIKFNGRYEESILIKQ